MIRTHWHWQYKYNFHNRLNHSSCYLSLLIPMLCASIDRDSLSLLMTRLFTGSLYNR